MRYSLLLIVLVMLLPLMPVTAASRYQTTPTDLIIAPGVYEASWKIPETRRVTTLFTASFEVRISRNPPFPLKNLPALTSKSPLYGTIGREEKPSADDMAFVLDESRGTGKGHNVLYLDSNRDRDFSDAYKVTCPTDSVSDANIMVPVKLLTPKSDNPNLAAIEFGFTESRGRGGIQMLGYWEGEVDTNKGKVKFALVDCNGDGVYGGSRKEDELNDLVYFFWDPKEPVGEYIPMCQDYFELLFAENIGNRLYALKADPSGESLEIRPYTGPKGRLTALPWNMKGHTFELTYVHVDNGSSSYSVNTGKAVVVPAGTYSVADGHVTWHGAKDTYWDMFVSGTKGIVVGDGQSVKILLGGQPKLSVKPIGLIRGTRQRISLCLSTDQGYNIEYLGGSPYKSRPRSDDLPLVLLKDGRGKTVARGKGMIERGDLYSTVDVPAKLKPGRYVIEAACDTGPFGGVVKASREVTIR